MVLYDFKKCPQNILDGTCILYKFRHLVFIVSTKLNNSSKI